WRGKRTFKLILFAVGAKGDAVTVNSLRFAGVRGALPALAGKETTWYPYQIVTQVAGEGDRGLHEESAVCLADAATVAQRLRVRQAEPQTLALVGQLPSGRARWDAGQHVLTLEGNGFQVVLTVSRAARWLGTFASALDFLAGNAAPEQATGSVWALALDG